MEHDASRRYHGHRGAGRSSPSGVHATRDARLGPPAGYAAAERAFRGYHEAKPVAFHAST
ncbi:hypothetical protein K0M31_012264, partial [Melipona bicolor]